MLHEQIVNGFDNGGSGDFIEAVVGGNVAAVRATQDSYIWFVQWEPFEWFLPRGAENDHRQVDGAANVHGSGVERDKQVCERENGGKFGDGGLPGQRASK